MHQAIKGTYFGCALEKRKKAPSSLKYSTVYIWRQSDNLWSSLKMSQESLKESIKGLTGGLIYLQKRLCVGLMHLFLVNKLVILYPGSENMHKLQFYFFSTWHCKKNCISNVHISDHHVFFGTVQFSATDLSLF